MLSIHRVQPGSKAAAAGLTTGDTIISINGEEVLDSISYRFLSTEERVRMLVRDVAGRTRRIGFAKVPDEDLGLEFAPFTIRRCRNRCIFCFVDQMPPGCRKSLYVRDDDYRASFLYGNFITLGALAESDWQRIFKERLSPLYVSVHATEPSVRQFLLQNDKAPDILQNLQRLALNGIRIHAQVVCCPGINDGAHLERTLRDLIKLHPAVQSIAVVPVGLTDYRRNLFPLRIFTKQEAAATVTLVNRIGDQMKKRNGERLVFASDELYIKAGITIPQASFYEEFPQIENGVGLVADFLRDAARTRIRIPKTTIRATIATGVSFSPILKKAMNRLVHDSGIDLRIVPVKNNFFGTTVTVAGLLTGSDLMKDLQGKRLGKVLIIPRAALLEDKGLFLDNMHLDELRQKLGIEVLPASRYGEVLRILKQYGEGVT